MKIIFALTFFLISVTTSAHARPWCEFLYVGKKVPVEWYTTSLFGGKKYSTKDAIVTGVNPSSNQATVRMVHNGEYINQGCGAFLTQQEKDSNG